MFMFWRNIVFHREKWHDAANWRVYGKKKIVVAGILFLMSQKHVQG